jgi:hypothetical protein
MMTSMKKDERKMMRLCQKDGTMPHDKMMMPTKQ